MKETRKINLDQNIKLVDSVYISNYTESGITAITFNTVEKGIAVEYIGEWETNSSSFVVDNYSLHKENRGGMEEVISIDYIVPTKHLISKSIEKNQILFIITPFSLLK